LEEFKKSFMTLLSIIEILWRIFVDDEMESKYYKEMHSKIDIQNNKTLSRKMSNNRK
jgi:hypothetical protein